MTPINDAAKMRMAMEKGYSIIYILQEDVYADRLDWDTKLISFLHAYDRPTAFTIRTRAPVNRSNMTYPLMESEPTKIQTILLDNAKE